jgi:hypothetical protein
MSDWSIHFNIKEKKTILHHAMQSDERPLSPMLLDIDINLPISCTIPSVLHFLETASAQFVSGALTLNFCSTFILGVWTYRL